MIKIKFRTRLAPRIEGRKKEQRERRDREYRRLNQH